MGKYGERVKNEERNFPSSPLGVHTQERRERSEISLPFPYERTRSGEREQGIKEMKGEEGREAQAREEGMWKKGWRERGDHLSIESLLSPL